MTLTLHLTPEPSGGGYKPIRLSDLSWSIEDNEPVARCGPYSWTFKEAVGTVSGWEVRQGDDVVGKGDIKPLGTVLGAIVTVEKVVVKLK